MEGFRFWKQGFWQDHLRGKPYHISALYVIDLDRFRWVVLQPGWYCCRGGSCCCRGTRAGGKGFG